MALERLLKQAGLHADTAYNGQEAIQKVVERNTAKKCGINCKPYQLVLMDYSMPVLDGVEATKLLRSKIQNSEINDLAIVGCTAFTSEKKNKRVSGKWYGLCGFEAGKS